MGEMSRALGLAHPQSEVRIGVKQQNMNNTRWLVGILILEDCAIAIPSTTLYSMTPCKHSNVCRTIEKFAWLCPRLSLYKDILGLEKSPV